MRVGHPFSCPTCESSRTPAKHLKPWALSYLLIPGHAYVLCICHISFVPLAIIFQRVADPTKLVCFQETQSPFCWRARIDDSHWRNFLVTSFLFLPSFTFKTNFIHANMVGKKKVVKTCHIICVDGNLAHVLVFFSFLYQRLFQRVRKLEIQLP